MRENGQMHDVKRLDEMTFVERSKMLLSLSERLHLTAMLAKYDGDGDDLWQRMEVLADRLLMESELIAARPHSLTVSAFAEAVGLLSEYERNQRGIQIYH
jgi:hypothetical protein